MISPKTIAKITLAGTLVAGVALVGCAGAQNGTVEGTDDVTNATTATDSNDTKATDAKDMDAKDTEKPELIDPAVIEPTEWKAATDAADATKKADLTGTFEVPETLKAHGIEFSGPTFSYTSGIVKATYDQPASMVEVRKGHGPVGTVVADDDVDFDATQTFKESWEAKAGDLTVNCYGNKKGEVLYADWYAKDDPEQDGESDAYSVRPVGLGGEDIPMTEEEVVTVVAAVK